MKKFARLHKNASTILFSVRSASGTFWIPAIRISRQYTITCSLVFRILNEISGVAGWRVRVGVVAARVGGDVARRWRVCVASSVPLAPAQAARAHPLNALYTLTSRSTAAFLKAFITCLFYYPRHTTDASWTWNTDELRYFTDKIILLLL